MIGTALVLEGCHRGSIVASLAVDADTARLRGTRHR